MTTRCRSTARFIRAQCFHHEISHVNRATLSQLCTIGSCTLLNCLRGRNGSRHSQSTQHFLHDLTRLADIELAGIALLERIHAFAHVAQAFAIHILDNPGASSAYLFVV